MKEIKAIIQPFMVPKVIQALGKIPKMSGVTLSEIKGFGRDQAENFEKAETHWGVTAVSKVKLETVVPDKFVNKVVKAIASSAHTGNLGDGKIFVYPVTTVIRIRTGERDEDAM